MATLNNPVLENYTANKLIKAKRKKTGNNTQKINLKNIVMPVTSINEVNQTINLKQEYFLPVFNNSPNEARSKLIYQNSKSTLLSRHPKREKSFNTTSTQARQAADASNSAADKSSKVLNATGRGESSQNKLLKKKSYSFHKLIEPKE